MKGKELFADRNVTLANGKTYKLEFSFQSLMELEDKKNGDFQAVFDMFEKEFNTKNLILGLWACLLTHHEDEFGFLTEEEIYKTFKKLINEENLLLIQASVILSFGAFWNKARQSKQLPEEYRKLFEEMEQQQNKKK